MSDMFFRVMASFLLLLTLFEGREEDFPGVPVGRRLRGHVRDVVEVVEGDVQDLSYQSLLLL